MAMVNQVNPAVISQPMYNPNVKDSRWLTLEVCREYQRSKCSRTENECKFAHPPPHVEVQNGRVTCCFDSIKGKCQRKEPPCKYLHPPQHLKEQLLQNGRNNLVMRNLQIQLATNGLPPMVQGSVYSPLTHPYMVQNPNYPYAPVANMPGILSGVDAAGNPTTSMPVTGVPTSAAPNMQSMMPATISQQPKLQRPDRLETSSSSNGSEPTTWTTSHPESITPVSQYSPVYFQPQLVEVLTGHGKKRPRDPADDLVLNTIGTMPTMVPAMVKRHAVDNKSGMPMYQPSTGSAAYQQAALAMQLQQQQFAPVTLSLLPGGHTSAAANAAAGALVTNATSVNYFDDSNQLLHTLPVCRDFKTGQCKRPQCKYVHLVEDYVEISDGKVTVCRDAAKGKCARPLCKYYHIPLPPQLLA